MRKKVEEVGEQGTGDGKTGYGIRVLEEEEQSTGGGRTGHGKRENRVWEAGKRLREADHAGRALCFSFSSDYRNKGSDVRSLGACHLYLHA